MDWLSLSLLCAFSLATADAATKKFLSDYSALQLTVIRFVFTGVLLAPLFLLEPVPRLPPPFWGWVTVAIPFEILAMVLYMRAIRSSPLAQTLPYLAFTPVFSTLTGFVLLGEKVSPIGFAGILLVTAGAYLLNLDRAVTNGRRALWSPFRAILRETGPRLMLAVAVLYSLTSVFGKAALRYAPPLFFGPFYFVLLGTAALGLVCARERGAVAVMWRRPGRHLIVGISMAVMVITHYLAIERVEVAYMITVKRTSLLFGILYGALLFEEAHLLQNLLAGTLMIAGVFLIAL